MDLPDEIVPVVLWQRHESPAHHDELHFVHAVAQLFQLIHPNNVKHILNYGIDK